ncbi:MAG: NUDIX hydrolase [Patescibacteria group bacterium]
MEDNQTQVALSVVKNPTGSVLLVKRYDPSLHGLENRLSWTFPGGKVYDDETHEEAAVREAYEETGHEVSVVRKIHEIIIPSQKVVLHYFACTLVSEAYTLLIDTSEVEQFRWVEPDLFSNFVYYDLASPVLEFINNK